jgi:peptide/nickel transport system permease protein
MPAFLARRLLLAAGVLAAVSFGSFTLVATKFSATCTSSYTPGTRYPPLASNAHQAASLWWDWLKNVPTGRSFRPVCVNGGFLSPFWDAVGHTAVLLALTMVLVVLFSLLLGTLAAVRAHSVLDGAFRGFSYLAWAIPSFLLALLFRSVLEWATAHHGFHLFATDGWPGGCVAAQFGNPDACPPPLHGLHYVAAVLQHVTVPAIALALAFIGLHSRYLRSALLVSLNAPFTTTAYAKGLTERKVVLRHALRNSLATFASALLLDMGAIFGAAMAVDWVFGLGGLGTLLLAQLNGVGGGGDAPAFLDAYSIENLLAFAALFVLASSFLAELAVSWLDPRARVQ